jgi:anaerobic magnesium-protoporphyrin IX monomethyl ester cyclase
LSSFGKIWYKLAMKVALVFPPQSHAVTPYFKTCLQERIGFLPPLGLISIATVLKAGNLAEVQVFDSLVEGWDHAGLQQALASFAPDVVGISTMTHTLIDALLVAQEVKRFNPEVKVGLGGPHLDIFPQASATFPDIDFIVCGEGEFSLAALVQKWQARGTQAIPGVWERGAPEHWSGPHFIEDLDRLPVPDRSLTPWQKYYTVVSKHPPTTSIISSRGCPYQCIFCRTAGGKAWRARSPAKVLEELEACVNLGIQEFFFFDENFTFDKQRALAICGLIKQRGLNLHFDLRCRANHVDLEVLKALRGAGAQRIQYGLESGSPRILQTIKKGLSVEQAEQAVRQAKQAGLTTYASFMLGHPGETAGDLRLTLDLALRLPLDFVDFSITMPYPCTELYALGKERGLITGDPWEEFALHPSQDFKIPYWEENFTRQELENYLGRAFRAFYIRPAYILHSLAQVRSAGELWRKTRAGLKVLLKI